MVASYNPHNRADRETEYELGENEELFGVYGMYSGTLFGSLGFIVRKREA